MPIKIICDVTGKETSFRSIGELNRFLETVGKKFPFIPILYKYMDENAVIFGEEVMYEVLNKISNIGMDQDMKINMVLNEYKGKRPLVIVDGFVDGAKTENEAQLITNVPFGEKVKRIKRIVRKHSDVKPTPDPVEKT